MKALLGPAREREIRRPAGFTLAKRTRRMNHPSREQYSGAVARLEPGLADDADDEGEQIDDQAVTEGDDAAFEAAPEQSWGDIAIADFQGVGRVVPAEGNGQDAEGQGVPTRSSLPAPHFPSPASIGNRFNRCADPWAVN